MLVSEQIKHLQQTRNTLIRAEVAEILQELQILENRAAGVVAMSGHMSGLGQASLMTQLALRNSRLTLAGVLNKVTH